MGSDDGLSKDVVYALRALAEVRQAVSGAVRDVQSLRREVAVLQSEHAVLNAQIRVLSAKGVPGAGVGPATETAAGKAPMRLHRGENNRAMEEYAASIRGKVVCESHLRCDFCPHMNGRFVGKGGRLLCQDCFAKGVRF